MDNLNIPAVSSPDTHLWYEDEQYLQTSFLGMSASIRAPEKVQMPVFLPANGEKQLTELTVSSYVDAPRSPLNEDPPQTDPLLVFDSYQTIIFEENKQQFGDEPSKLINAVDKAMRGNREPVQTKSSPADDHLRIVSPRMKKASQKRPHSSTDAGIPTLSETVKTPRKRLRSTVRVAARSQNSAAASSKVKRSVQLVSDHSSSDEDPTKWIVKLPKSEMPYTHKCGYPGCKAKYPRLSQLKLHFFNHTRSSPYKCIHGECGGKCFRSNRDLLRHIITVHTQDRRFPCQICGFKFRRKDHLQSHMRVVHDKTLQ